MKKLLLLLNLICLAFLGCDGKERIHLSNTEVLKEHKLLDSFAEQVEYIPEYYTEVINDTIFSNGYDVKIKMYSDSLRTVTVKSKENRSQSTIYRDFNADILITKQDNEILNVTFNKDHPKIIELLSRLRMDAYYMKNVWIEEKLEQKYKGAPAVYLKFYAPSQNSFTVIEIFPIGDNEYSITEL